MRVHPLIWMVIITLGLFVAVAILVPRKPVKTPDRPRMTAAEKKFGCRFNETYKDEKGLDTGECY